MNTKSGFGSHFLSLLALTAMLALLILIAAAPFARLGGLEKSIDEQRVLLTQLRRLAAEEQKISQQEARHVSAERQEQLLLAGETMGIAGANLQKQIKNLIMQSGGTVSSIQVMPPKADADLMRIAVRVSFRVGNDGLRDILYGLETRVPLSFVDEISIRTSAKNQARARGSSLKPLDVSMDIGGFFMKGNAS